MIGEDENGASIIRAGDFIDPTAILAQVSVPAAVWERLTADLRDDDRVSLDRPELPDVSLRARITMFLEMELIGWSGSLLHEALDIDRPATSDNDLGDEAGF